ncbi:helix-turn-helix domain-containing protein, partial [Streptomyces zhihengii]
MGGGRLTPRDREDIEAGLAAGLACAAIARRLGRPTSTVSREVARNGGRGG